MRALLVAAAIAGTVQTVDAAQPRDLLEGERSIVEEVIRGLLKDPASAQFKWRKTTDGGEYCGAVNAKNSFGGYDGFKSFLIPVRRNASGEIVEASEPVDWVEAPDEDFGDAAAMEAALRRRCAAASGE
jgi:hypothetical protein